MNRLPGLYAETWWPVFMNACAVAVAAAFFMDAWSGRFAMSEQVHGKAVFLIPAEAWSAMLFTLHGAFLIGLMTDRVLVCFVSSTSLALVYLLFFIMSSGAQFGGIVVYFGGLFFAPIFMVLSIQSAHELRGQANAAKI